MKQSLSVLTILLLSFFGQFFAYTHTYGWSQNIDTIRTYTFSDLGYPEIRFGQYELDTQSYQFVLPQDASQGPDLWYVVSLNYQIKFAENCGDGVFYVYVDINEYCCALFEFNTEKIDNELIVRWNTADLLDGHTGGETLTAKLDVNFKNYVNTFGIRGGVNKITFRAEAIGDSVIEELVFNDDSAIECTTTAPPHLTLNAIVSKDNVVVGENFVISFKIENTGDIPAKDVTIRILYPDEALNIQGDNKQTYHELYREQEGDFIFKPV